jgi:predicted double-glycine peptidase
MTMILNMIENINYIKQPTGNSCGPTCIKMVQTTLNGLSDTNFPTIEEISEICGTDWIVGTPPDRMEKGLQNLNIPFIHHLNLNEPFEFLKTVLKNGNIPILRTFTHNVPHWIIVTSFIDGRYNINDPWLGRIQYTESELNNIWVKRHYEFFEIERLRIKKTIPKDRLEEIIEWSFPYFKHVISKKTFENVINHEIDFNLSAMLVDNNDKILGVYIIGRSQLPIKYGYHKLRGIEGVMLAVDESIRGMGWGNKLKDYPKILGYDYIWGYQASGLNNINDWLKRRVLICDLKNLYITAEFY